MMMELKYNYLSLKVGKATKRRKKIWGLIARLNSMCRVYFIIE